MFFLMQFGFWSNKVSDLNTVPFNILLRSLEKKNGYIYDLLFPYLDLSGVSDEWEFVVLNV